MPRTYAQLFIADAQIQCVTRIQFAMGSAQQAALQDLRGTRCVDIGQRHIKIGVDRAALGPKRHGHRPAERQRFVGCEQIVNARKLRERCE